MKATIVVAFDEDRAIAKGGKIPWYISEDLKLFRQLTVGHCVIMGRKTWDSLPLKPLPDRTNIVITRNKDYTRLAFLASTLDEALAVAAREAPGKEVFIIGGEQVYKDALASGVVDRVVASHIKGRFDGDQFFPGLYGWNRRLIKAYNDFEVYEHGPA